MSYLGMNHIPVGDEEGPPLMRFLAFSGAVIYYVVTALVWS